MQSGVRNYFLIVFYCGYYGFYIHQLSQMAFLKESV